MNHTEQQIYKLATEKYGLALTGGAHFEVNDLAEELDVELADRFAEQDSVARDLLTSAVHACMRRVDRERTKFDTQLALVDDLDRPIPVSRGRRIARRRMGMEDWLSHLAHVSENASRVNASAARESSRFAALSPYLADRDTESAIRAWQADYPDEVLP